MTNNLPLISSKQLASEHLALHIITQLTPQFTQTTYLTQINKPVNKIVVSEVVHSGREVTQNEEPFVLVQAEVVFRIVQQVEQRPT